MISLLAGPHATLLSRLVLGGVFLFAGGSKVLDPGALAASIRTYGLGLPEWFVTFSAYSLPHIEVTIGLYLHEGLGLATTGLRPCSRSPSCRAPCAAWR